MNSLIIYWNNNNIFLKLSFCVIIYARNDVNRQQHPMVACNRCLFGELFIASEGDASSSLKCRIILWSKSEDFSTSIVILALSLSEWNIPSSVIYSWGFKYRFWIWREHQNKLNKYWNKMTINRRLVDDVRSFIRSRWIPTTSVLLSYILKHLSLRPAWGWVSYEFDRIFLKKSRFDSNGDNKKLCVYVPKQIDNYVWK